MDKQGTKWEYLVQTPIMLSTCFYMLQMSHLYAAQRFFSLSITMLMY